MVLRQAKIHHTFRAVELWLLGQHLKLGLWSGVQVWVAAERKISPPFPQEAGVARAGRALMDGQAHRRPHLCADRREPFPMMRQKDAPVPNSIRGACPLLRLTPLNVLWTQERPLESGC